MTITIQRSGLAVLLVVPALALGACGSSSSGGGSSSDDQQAITQIIKQGGSDPASICDHLTKEVLQKQFGGSKDKCQKAATSDPSAKDPSVKVDSITVNGNTATAHITGNSGKQTLHFVKQDGDWKLSGT